MEKSTAAASPTAASPPTTFVQADPHSFRDVVQKLTGAASGDSSDKLPVTTPSRPAVGPRRSSFKLHDRRPSIKKLEIKLGYASIHSPRLRPHPDGSPSPVTPLVVDGAFSPAVAEEERAIAQKGFYLHPSPRAATTPRGSDPPELLTLFPLTSPKQAKPPGEICLVD